MQHQFRLFIEQNLNNSRKSTSSYGDLITAQKISDKLLKLIQKKEQQTSANKLSLQKLGVTLPKTIVLQNTEKESLQKNQIFMDSLMQVSTFLLKLAYSHPGIFAYPKYQISNIIGFYQLSKYIYHSEDILDSKQMNRTFNEELIGLIFTQRVAVYKDIYYRVEESQIFKSFIKQIFALTEQRINRMFRLFGLDSSSLTKTCLSHIKSFIQRYQMSQSVKYFQKNQQNSYLSLIISKPVSPMILSQSFTSPSQIQSEEFLNVISIDEIILCFVYLTYRMKTGFTHVRMFNIIESYYRDVLRWKKWKNSDRVLELYNSCYLRLYLAEKLEKIDKQAIKFDQTKTQQFLAPLVDSGQTILDNFVSSLEN